MVSQLELKLGMADLLGHMKMLKMSHTNWPSQNGSCFIMVLSERELEKIPEGKWIDEMSPNFVELSYIDRRRPRKIFRHNGAR